MKKHLISFYLPIGFILIMIVIIGESCVSLSSVHSESSLEYIVAGGMPGDMQIDNILVINSEGVCHYKTLTTQCEFLIEKDKAENIFNHAKEIMQKTPERENGFLPDSTISAIRIYETELKDEVAFYADEYLEHRYPALKRPEQFKALETLLKEIIYRHCDGNEESDEHS